MFPHRRFLLLSCIVVAVAGCAVSTSYMQPAKEALHPTVARVCDGGVLGVLCSSRREGREVKWSRERAPQRARRTSIADS